MNDGWERGGDDGATVLDGATSNASRTSARLVGLSGAVAGETWTIPERGGLIGRIRDAEICIEDWSISRRHAEIAVTEGGFKISDIASSNGTKVNGRRVETALLREGDTVRLGRLVFRFTVATLGEGADGQSFIAAKAPEQSTHRSRRRNRRHRKSRRGLVLALALGIIVGGTLVFIVSSSRNERETAASVLTLGPATAPATTSAPATATATDPASATASARAPTPPQTEASSRLSQRDLTRALAETEPNARLRTALVRYHRGEIDAAIAIAKRLAIAHSAHRTGNRAEHVLGHLTTVRDAFRQLTARDKSVLTSATERLWRSIDTADRALLPTIADSFFRVRATAALSR